MLLLLVITLITLTAAEDRPQFNIQQLRQDFVNVFNEKLRTMAEKFANDPIVIPFAETQFKARLTTGTMLLRDIKLPKAMSRFRPAQTNEQAMTIDKSGHHLSFSLVKYDLPFEFNGNIRWMGVNSLHDFSGTFQWLRVQFRVTYNENDKSMSLVKPLLIRTPAYSVDENPIRPATSFTLSRVFQNFIANKVADQIASLILPHYKQLLENVLDEEVPKWAQDYQRLLDKNNWDPRLLDRQ